MKKVLSIIIAIAMIALLVSCSKNDNANTSKHGAKTSYKHQSTNKATEDSTKTPKSRISKVTVIGEISEADLALEEWNGADALGNRSSLIPCVWNLKYDKNNNLISKECSSEEENTTCGIYYTYDSNHNVLNETLKTNGKIRNIQKKTYYKNGIIKTNYNESKTKNGTYSKETYDKYGNVIFSEGTSALGSKSYEKHIYNYDDKGNIIKDKSVSYVDSDGRGEIITTKTYSYDENGNKITENFKAGKNYSGVSSYSNKWEYNEKGKLKYKKSTTGNSIVETTYKFDSSDNIISETKVNHDTDKTTVTTWKYNTDNKPIVKKIDGVEDTNYTYDTSGNLIKLKETDQTTTYKYFSDGKVKNKTIETKLSKQSWSYDRFENLTEYSAENWQYESDKYKVVFKYEEI